MKNLSEIVKLDIKASMHAFKADDFDNANIFANRAMANAIMGKDRKLILPGFFMKDLSTSYGIIQVQRVSALSTAKTVANKHLKILEKLLDDEKLKEKELWDFFYKLNLELKDFLKSPFEKDTYKSDDPEFSHAAFAWLLNYLKERKEILVSTRNSLLKGVINEMDRIFKVHGGYESETYAISLVKALDRYYDYFRVAYRTDTGIDEEKVKSIIFPYIDQITTMSKIMEVLWELVSGWRKFFIEYTELRIRGMAVEKGVELPEEAKRKLTESVTKALEKEVKVK